MFHMIAYPLKHFVLWSKALIYLFSPREQKNAGTGHWTVVPWNEGLGIVTLYYEVMFFVTSQI